MNSAGQPIELASMDFQVDPQGRITVEGQAAGQLFIGEAEDPLSFVKEGSGLLRYEGDNAPAAAESEEPLVAQGYLEQSNVDMTRVMTDMLRTYRGFESNQKVLQAYDQSMQKAVTEIGRI